MEITRKPGQVLAVVLAAALGLAGYIYIIVPWQERAAQKNKLYEAMDRLISISSSGSSQEFTRRELDARAAVMGLEELDPDWAEGEESKELRQVFLYLTYLPVYEPDDKVINKELLMQLSEVELNSPPRENRAAYRDLRRILAEETRGEVARTFLSPWADGAKVRDALITRAEGHLRNAKILAGHKKGEIYQPPAPREASEWNKLLPPEYPGSRQR